MIRIGHDRFPLKIESFGTVTPIVSMFLFFASQFVMLTLYSPSYRNMMIKLFENVAKRVQSLCLIIIIQTRVYEFAQCL